MSEPQGSPAPDEQRKMDEAARLGLVMGPGGKYVMPTEPKPQREIRVVTSDVPIFDTGKFEHMQRVATMIMKSRAYDDSLRFDSFFEEAEQKSFIREAAEETVLARCVMIVNKAINWQMDPFDLAGACFYRQGQLVWQGKVIQAVIEKRLGLRLKYEIIPARDDDPQSLAIRCWGRFDDETEDRMVEGSVKFFNRDNSAAWAYAEDWPRMLHYAITREWARLNAPGVILGIVTAEEQSRTISDRKVTGRAKVEAPELPEDEEEPSEPTPLPTDPMEMARALTEGMAMSGYQKEITLPGSTTRTHLDPDAFLENLEYLLGKCESDDEVSKVAADNNDAIFDLPETHRLTAIKMLKEAEHGA